MVVWPDRIGDPIGLPDGDPFGGRGDRGLDAVVQILILSQLIAYTDGAGRLRARASPSARCWTISTAAFRARGCAGGYLPFFGR
jgi:hypothetical protein